MVSRSIRAHAVAVLAAADAAALVAVGMVVVVVWAITCACSCHCLNKQGKRINPAASAATTGGGVGTEVGAAEVAAATTAGAAALAVSVSVGQSSSLWWSYPVLIIAILLQCRHAVTDKPKGSSSLGLPVGYLFVGAKGHEAPMPRTPRSGTGKASFNRS